MLAGQGIWSQPHWHMQVRTHAVYDRPSAKAYLSRSAVKRQVLVQQPEACRAVVLLQWAAVIVRDGQGMVGFDEKIIVQSWVIIVVACSCQVQ